jgi:hypothetical protein
LERVTPEAFLARRAFADALLRGFVLAEVRLLMSDFFWIAMMISPRGGLGFGRRLDFSIRLALSPIAILGPNSKMA